MRFSRPAVVLVALALACAGGPSGGAGVLFETPPGAQPFDADLTAKLQAAWQARPARYTPRTRHLEPDGTPRYTNRLLLESSPYLLQHAHNPVNWYPWGELAFETARRLGRPVLLSVGYATCHWCHVMEEESFEDLEIARVLNEGYVAIKVDREERPDVDDVYMSAVQALTGSGGWPMTVWLTADRKPFFGGSYFPPRDGDRGVVTGFLSLLRRLRQVHADEGARVAATADSVVASVREALVASAAPGLPDAEALHAAARAAKATYDAEWGGVTGAPKFPASLPIRFLLRYHRRTGDPQALEMATHTLARMAAGGIHDQLGGGFHRYSVDVRWLVPHFEKMLYDNALLAVAYLEGYQASGRAEFADVALGILAYVAREMTSSEGAFYSATDADSPGPDGRREEGRFFTWTPVEIRSVVGRDQAPLVEAAFGVTPAGNFEGRSVLSRPRPLVDVARDLGLEPEKARAALATAREHLLAERGRRPPPLRDEKILAAWNGLMISALARAASALAEPRYAAQAARAAEFVLDRMRERGRLLRSYSEGRPRHDAYLEDYAFLIAGLIDLHEVDRRPRWLAEALALDRVLEADFEDKSAGGYFTTTEGHDTLLARAKPAYDGALPSGNAVQALNLLRLHALTGDEAYRRRGEATLRAVSGDLARAPAAFGELLLAAEFRLDSAKPQAPERRAIAYLAQEVPGWRREHACGSCHNNGDGARALFRALRLGYAVPVEALASTQDWLATPERWELEAGEPGTSDTKLARLQFGASLLAATDAGVMNDRGLLRRTAASLAADQSPDGAWRIAEQTSLGSPVAWGPSVATWLARQALLAADPDRFTAEAARAEAYFVANPPRNVMDAAAAALALAEGTSKAARERRQEALDLLVAAQTGDGGWGPYKGTAPEAFDTALSLLALARAAGDPYRDAVRKGREYLTRTQLEEGGWKETTRPPGYQSYAQHLSTTGWATLALIETRPVSESAATRPGSAGSR